MRPLPAKPSPLPPPPRLTGGVLLCLFLAFASGSRAGIRSYTIEKNGKTLGINGAEKKGPDHLLLTHSRRDVVESTRNAAGDQTRILAPAASRERLENAEAHWQSWWIERFDYYGQEVTRIPTENFPADRYLEDGEEFEWEGIPVRFLSLPGYTRDGGAYVLTLSDGRKNAYVGELLLHGGRVPDLYSFQNAVPEAKIGSYHGYLGRLSLWIASLEKLRAENVDAILPARGEPIADPDSTIRTAIARARDIYRNYLSTNALHWYFGEERMGKAAELVLGENHGVTGMPFAEHVDLPEWCHHIGTTKLLISENRRAFALDVGGRRQFETLFKYRETDLISRIDGIFVTHTHNDHSAFVADAQREFDCPVYAVHEVADVISSPGKWHLPGIPNNPVDRVRTVADGETMTWEEFTFTFRFFPGQMYNHGALLVEKPGERPVFFIGDSFSPSGIDDYCLMNRNLIRDGSGYFRCFDIVEQLPPGSWLVNQHINHRFRFSGKEFDFLKSGYRKRREMIAEFVAWDDPNYGVDEQWAWFYPYGQPSKPGATVTAKLRLTNHSPVERTFEMECPGTPFLTPLEERKQVTLAPGEKTECPFSFRVAKDAPSRTHVFTANITSEPGLHRKHWIEGLVHLGPAG